MTPPRMNADDRKEAIVLAALPLFAEFGMNAVKTKMIAQVAGVSEALLYKHFEDKESIYRAIQKHCVEHATETVQALNSLPDNTATLVFCTYALVWKIQKGPKELRERHSQVRRLMTRSLLGEGAFAKQFLDATSNLWVDKFRKCIGASIENGDLPLDCHDSELGIWFAHHISVTVALFRLPENTILEYPIDSSALIEKTARFCLRGLGLKQESIDQYLDAKEIERFLENYTLQNNGANIPYLKTAGE